MGSQSALHSMVEEDPNCILNQIWVVLYCRTVAAVGLYTNKNQALSTGLKII
jgi:hypothetical protein